jgi:DNA-binding transcriptional LysR family regulator
VLSFDMHTMSTNLEDSLRDGIVDIAIDWLPVELDPFVKAKLFDDRFVLMARSDHSLLKAQVTIDDLREARSVSLQYGAAPREAARFAGPSEPAGTPQCVDLHDLA